MLALYIVNLLAASGPPAGFGTGPKAGDVLAPCGGTAVASAIGCIPITNNTTLAATAAGILVGVAGGVALILMSIASYQIMTSQGDPRRLQAARDLLFSAIAGLILVILSGFALRLIGVNILGIF